MKKFEFVSPKFELIDIDENVVMTASSDDTCTTYQRQVINNPIDFVDDPDKFGL